jgi:transposase-like protein
MPPPRGRRASGDFGESRNAGYPVIYRSRISRRDDLREFFRYPPEIRRAIYTANAVGPLTYRLRKVTRKRPAFAGDDAIFRILYLAVRNASRRRTMPVRLWGTALNRFASMFGNERVPFKWFFIYTKILSGSWRSL